MRNGTIRRYLALALVLAVATLPCACTTSPQRGIAAAPPPSRDDGLRWTGGDGRATPQALALVAALQGAADAGLDAVDYRVALPDAPLDATGAAAFERALDAATLAYAHDVRFGRIDPRAVGVDLAPPATEPVDTTLLATLAASPSPAASLRALEPALPIYARLRDALARERALAAVAWPPLPADPRVLEPGDADAMLDPLAARLALLGDLPADAGPFVRHEGALLAAVAAFQRRHGLDADGRVGPATRAALDVPPAARAAQVALALERLRWLRVDPARPPIVVNVPEFRLRAIGDDRRVALAMDVVVGAALDRATPLFAGELTRVVFQPEWVVPASIARDELLPRERREPGWLARNGYAMRGGALVQRPGPGNALGRVKFLLPNAYAVYLHDTPARALFGRARRDFSHGCIRVADPAALAAFVLRRDPAWPRERVAAALAGDATIAAAVDPPIPVRVVYLTAVVGEDGVLRFLPDIYGHDARLAAALAARAARP